MMIRQRVYAAYNLMPCSLTGFEAGIIIYASSSDILFLIHLHFIKNGHNAN
jgi:hypothetical protein